MGLLILILAVGAALVTVLFVLPMLRESRRRHIRHKPFPAEWRAFLERDLGIYRRLPGALQQQLQGHIQIFLAEKQFVGCNGLVVTDEMRVTIAALACLLLLNRKTGYFRELHSVLVYPDAFIVRDEAMDAAGVITRQHEVRAGESWDAGRVIVSWDDLKHGATYPADGYNLVLHEFAHQLDQESGSANGAPPLGRRSRYKRWSQVLGAEFARLREQAASGEHTLLDPYGAENPAEFFAVVTEVFFERPAELRTEHPELYRELQGYYRVDPAAW